MKAGAGAAAKVDALRMPFYSSSHPIGSQVGGIYLIREILVQAPTANDGRRINKGYKIAI